MARRRKTAGKAVKAQRWGGGEKPAVTADVQEDEAAMLLASDQWTHWFEPGAKRRPGWKSNSIRLCTIIMTSENTVAGMSGALDWIRANCETLIHTLEGHRVVEAALRRHFDFVGNTVAEKLLADTRLNCWSGRVWSCLLRYGRHSEVGHTCAAAMAERATAIWESDRNASAVYVLQTLVERDYEAAGKVMALWFRQDALRKLTLRQPHYMTCLLACLRSQRPERRELIAMFLLLFDNVNLCYTVMKALLRVKTVGVLILCEIAQHSVELNVWFSDYFQTFLEEASNTRPEVLPRGHLSPPTPESIQLFLECDRALRAPKAIRCASGLAQNGNSALTLYCRLLNVQFERERVSQDDGESECETPPELWAATPEDLAGVWSAGAF
jgi:hypothetical protein